MTEEQKYSLLKYIDLVRNHYGDRVVEIAVFGSRARGDHHQESDLDLAIVLKDGDWEIWRERHWLAGETFFPLVESGLHIQPRPIRESAWRNPETHANPRLIQNIRRDARPVSEAA